MDLKKARQMLLDYVSKGINWRNTFNKKGKPSKDDYYISGVYDQMSRSSTKIGLHSEVVNFLEGLDQNWTSLVDDYKKQLIKDSEALKDTEVTIAYIDGVADEIAHEKIIGTYSDPTIKKEESPSK